MTPAIEVHDLRRSFRLPGGLLGQDRQEVAVMYLGRIVEKAEADALFRAPRHPYTQALLASVLTPEPGLGVPDVGLGDILPDPANIPPGCRFHPRCRIAVERCRVEAPQPMVRDAAAMVECHLA